MTSTSPWGADDVCLARVAEGAGDALAELYRRHSETVWAVCVRVCGDRTLAEDVCQTVFGELWSAPERFDPARGSFRGWLVALARSRAVDAVRAESARRVREGRVAGWAETQVAPDGFLAAVRAEVRGSVAGLPAGERDAILLTYFGGFSYREAAGRLGEPEGTIKSRIRAGLRRLREDLDAKGTDP